MQRYGQVIGGKPEQVAAYEAIHREVWSEVLATIHACNMRNYSIFRYETLLFAYFEYIGNDFAADMAKMAADPKTQEWWAVTALMQQQVPEHTSEDWWTIIPEVFHTA